MAASAATSTHYRLRAWRSTAFRFAALMLLAATPGCFGPAGALAQNAAAPDTLLSQQYQPRPQYGQAAGSALDQEPPQLPQYGQPAGSALDQGLSPPLQPLLKTPSTNIQTGSPSGSSGGSLGGQACPRNASSNAGSDLCPIDIGSLKLSKLEVDLENAQFMAAAVDKLHFIANDLDVQNGALSGLNIAVKGGRFKDVAFDQLNIASQGDLHFDRDQFLGNKTLQFTTPASAQVMAVVSQDSLNRFLNSPTTLQRLSETAASKVKFLANMFGSNANIGLTLSEASVLLLKSNHVEIGVKAQLGLGKIGVPLPLSLVTKLGLNAEGWLSLSETHLNANGQEISPLLSNMLVKHVNEMADWAKLSDDIKFSFSELKVIPNKQFMVRGTAQINRLRFGLAN